MTPATYIRERREALNYTREDLAFHTMAMIRTYGADGVDPVTPWLIQELELGNIDFRQVPAIYLISIVAVLTVPMRDLTTLIAFEWTKEARERRKVPA